MRRSMCVLLFVFAGWGLSGVRADEKPGDYLKDGKLKEAVEVRKLQGGFAGFTSTYCRIEPDGSWSTGAVLPRDKVQEKAKGKLTAEQLAGLAKEFAKFDLAHLPNHGEAVTNPKVVRVRFGMATSELQPKPGKATPEEDKAVRARYDGIAQAVKAVCKEPKKD